MLIDIPASWSNILAPEFTKPYFEKLTAFVDGQRAEHEVYPPEADVFNTFRMSTYEDTRVLIVGQDPYHDTGQAHGLCFSVRPGVKPPPSLRNIFVERKNDVGLPIAKTGFLEPWARQGILMLNTVLTVRAHEANSHKGQGWEKFTDHVIHVLGERETPTIFVLWGGPAQKKKALIDTTRHVIIESAHPSPLSAHNGFFGSRPFSRINESLRAFDAPEIDWRLPGDE